MYTYSTTPIKLQHDELWSVCVVRDTTQNPEIYRVYVGDNMLRMFDVKTLPDMIKEKLAMVHGLGVDEQVIAPMNIAWELNPPDHYPREFINIGWFVANSNATNIYYYQVVLSFEELSVIRGMKLTFPQQRKTA